MHIKHKCEVCNFSDLELVLDLGPHPLCDDLVKIGSSERCKEYPIQILFCPNCKTAHQRYGVQKNELFKPTYHYRARMTGSVLAGMKQLVESTEDEFGSLSQKKVLDIGCNDGSLLNYFKEKGAITVGVEPTDAANDSTHETYKAFFDDEVSKKLHTLHGHFDFITFTNVFAHIENLPQLIKNLKKIINQKTVIIIENHYLGDIFTGGQFDTFYHEHPRTYSYSSFKFIAKSLGLEILKIEFVKRYGGNIRVFLGNGLPTNTQVEESDFSEKFSRLRQELLTWKISAKKLISDLNLKYGPLRAKAFPGRAAILIKLLELDESHISAVYEIKGSIKVGHYVPGTRIPIVPEVELFKLDKTIPILNLAWHIPQEVRANLLSHGYTGTVYDIK